MATLVAGELYYELDGQLLEIKRQLRQPNGYPFNPNQLKVALQNAIEGKFGEVPQATPENQISLFSVIATMNLGAVAGKKTRKCFVGNRWYYRDGDFDNWLPANQPNAEACAITVLGLSRDWTFAEAAAAVLGIGTDTSIQLLGKALIENGLTMTLAQAEEMVEATERGGNTGIRTNGLGNFFFVETGDPKDPVSVGYVHRAEHDWNARLDRLGGGRRWRAGRRLLLRNLATSRLGY